MHLRTNLTDISGKAIIANRQQVKMLRNKVIVPYYSQGGRQVRLGVFLVVLAGLTACDKPTSTQQTATQQYSEAEQQLLVQGSQKARSCAACHGPRGISRQALYPSLAGRPAPALALAMHEYRDGSRKNALMSPQARSLSDADIELLAAYYALLPAPNADTASQ